MIPHQTAIKAKLVICKIEPISKSNPRSLKEEKGITLVQHFVHMHSLIKLHSSIEYTTYNISKFYNIEKITLNILNKILIIIELIPQ